MNEKQAIAYGQIAMDELLNSTYKKNINIQNFGIEMRQAFKLYPRSIVLQIADAKVFAERKLAAKKSGDTNE